MPFRFSDRIVSGGQVGVDRAALDFAIEHRYPHGGYCPKGRKAEDGTIPMRYQLVETDSEGYRQRTRRNVEESDATLILNAGGLDGGSLETKRIAERLGKPVLVVALDAALEPIDDLVSQTLDWLRSHSVSTLNIAGPRESKRLGIYALAYAFLSRLAGEVEPSVVAAGVHEATTSDDTSDPPGDLNETLARRRTLGLSSRIHCLTPYVAPWPPSSDSPEAASASPSSETSTPKKPG